jgi:intein/homing endonuclease
MRGSQKNINFVIKWTSPFAYSIGLLTADGCLYNDGRHINLTSKDIEQIINFKECLNLKNRIGKKARGGEKIKKYYCVQFSNVKLYKFLKNIGLTPRKSLTLQKVKIPIEFFSDFLRGLFDGDGNFHTFIHPESQHVQVRTRFSSASPYFIRWLQQEINEKINTKGFITKTPRAEHLEYAKEDSAKLLSYMYYSPNVICLSRKFQKARPYF